MPLESRLSRLGGALNPLILNPSPFKPDWSAGRSSLDGNVSDMMLPLSQLVGLQCAMRGDAGSSVLFP